MDILKKKWKVVRAAFGHLYNALNEVGLNWDPANKDDSKVWADLELLREKVDELAKSDEKRQERDSWTKKRKYKRISLYVWKCISAAN